HSSSAAPMLQPPRMRSRRRTAGEGWYCHTCAACTCIDSASQAMPQKLSNSAAVSIRLAESDSCMGVFILAVAQLPCMRALAELARGNHRHGRSAEQEQVDAGYRPVTLRQRPQQ